MSSGSSNSKKTLTNSQDISKYLISSIKDKFPINSETELREIIEFIDSKIQFEFHIGILEKELLTNTTNKKCRRLIQLYFHSVNLHYKSLKEKSLKGKKVRVKKIKKPKKPTVIKAIYPSREEIDKVDHIEAVKTWHDTENEIKRLEHRTGLWREVMPNSETEEDPIHRK